MKMRFNSKLSRKLESLRSSIGDDSPEDFGSFKGDLGCIKRGSPVSLSACFSSC